MVSPTFLSEHTQQLKLSADLVYHLCFRISVLLEPGLMERSVWSALLVHFLILLRIRLALLALLVTIHLWLDQVLTLAKYASQARLPLKDLQTVLNARQDNSHQVMAPQNALFVVPVPILPIQLIASNVHQDPTAHLKILPNVLNALLVLLIVSLALLVLRDV